MATSITNMATTSAVKPPLSSSWLLGDNNETEVTSGYYVAPPSSQVLCKREDDKTELPGMAASSSPLRASTAGAHGGGDGGQMAVTIKGGTLWGVGHTRKL